MSTNVISIVCPATDADIQAFIDGNNTLLSCPLSQAPFLVNTTLLKARSLGNTLAAVAYGIAILLYLSCIGHLQCRSTQFLEFKRKWGPYAYITGMIGLSTVAFLQSTIYITTSNSIIHAEQIHNFADTMMACGCSVPVLFTIWMADGLMVSSNYPETIQRDVLNFLCSYIIRSACISELSHSGDTSYLLSLVLYFWFPWVYILFN